MRDPSEIGTKEGGPDDTTRDVAQRDAKSLYTFGRLNSNEGERERERGTRTHTCSSNEYVEKTGERKREREK